MFLERTGRAQDPGVGARGLKTYWGLAYWREGQRHTMTHQPATPDPAHRTLHTSPPCADGTLHLLCTARAPQCCAHEKAPPWRGFDVEAVCLISRGRRAGHAGPARVRVFVDFLAERLR